jgi:HK97 family phage major capsid protein
MAVTQAAVRKAMDALRVAEKKTSPHAEFLKLENKARRAMGTGIERLSREQNPTGALREYSDEISRTRPLSMTNSVWVPHSAPVRELTQAGTAGFLTSTKVMAARPYTQPVPVVMQLGAQTIAVNDSAAIPKIVTPATATQLQTESSAASTSNQVLGQVALVPVTTAAYSEVSGLLLKQSNAQQILSTDIYRATYTQMDRECLTGTGQSGDVLGLLNTLQANQFSGASLALSTLLATQTSAGDTLNQTAAYTCNRATAALLRARAEFAGSTKTLWEGGLARGTITDVPAISTGELPNGALIFGSWSWCVIALWGQIEIGINPYSQANFQAGIIGIRALCTFDFATIWPQAFAVSTSVT